MSAPIAVFKLGGSVLRGERSLALAVHELYGAWRRGARVVAVVSALEGETDALFESGRRVGPEGDGAALAALVATGEARSAALLGLALERAGLRAAVLDPARAGLVAAGPRFDARPTALDARPFERAFDEAAVAVLPGFVGRAADGGPALFGRGGSDLSALFVADALGARERVLVKDVDGIYARDPALDPLAPRYASLSFDDALSLRGEVLQAKATRFAAERELAFDVRALGSLDGTRVGAPRTLLAGPRRHAPPLRVALAGLGTVGLGVFRALNELPERYELVAVLARDARRPGRADVPRGLFAGDADELLASNADVLVELAGGIEPARGWIARALARGVDVVTANKALIAEHGPALDALARAGGARLLRSASVGGAMPALEAVRRAARRGGLAGLEGVLNGTTSFVLDEVAAGAPLELAVRRAQERGYAEADPARDLDGRDAADKLRALVAEVGRADGLARELEWESRAGLEELDISAVRAAHARGERVRLVASVRLSGARALASLGLRTLAAEHALVRGEGAGNALALDFEDGTRELVAGAGAGRWPTTEAVLADLEDLRRRAALVGATAEAAA